MHILHSLPAALIRRGNIDPVHKIMQHSGRQFLQVGIFLRPEDTHRIGRTGRAKKEGVSYLFYVPEEKKRVQELLRLTRNTDLCTPVHFDFNHEHIVVEKKQDNADRFQIKCYF